MEKKSEQIRNTAKYKPKNHTLYPGQKPDLFEIEEQLLDFIALNINAKNPLTIWTIVTYCDKIYTEKAKDLFNTKYIRIYLFIKKHGFTVRKPTKQGHIYPKNSFELIINYLKDIYEFRRKYIKDISLITNMDETPIFFTPQLNGIIAPKGSLQVVVSTTDQEKQRVTVVLSVAGNGAKLKPFFIFCGKTESAILYNRIKKIPQFKNKEAYFNINKNGWMTFSIMNLYIETVYLDYIYDVTRSKEFESMLILVCATIHLVNDEFNPFFKYNINSIYVPKGLTPVCQPLDMTINKLIKDKMKRQYLQWRSSLLDNNNTKVTRQNVIDCFCNGWKNENVVPCQLIKNTFKQAGIIVSLT